MDFNLEDTIVALSSGVAPGRRCLLRLSGSKTRGILSRLLVSALLDVKHATCFESAIQFGDGHDSNLQLEVLCYYWPDGRSFTGESCAELHMVGSLPLAEIVIERIQRLGARAAERGEFTLRSFFAQKLDLTQVEAVLGVIEAQDDQQLHQALEQLGGNLSQPVRVLRDELIDLVGHLEAGLDFVEEDIEFISEDQLVQQLQGVRQRLSEISEQLDSRGSRTRNPNVVLVGLPNAGKSTLFNSLLGEERAIVSRLAGTTRDAVSATLSVGGVNVELVDTAGIEELQEHSPRAMAQSVLRSRLETADLILFCHAANGGEDSLWLEEQLALLPPRAQRILVGTKADCAVWSQADVQVRQDSEESVELLRVRIANCLGASDHKLQSDAMHLALLRSRQAVDLANLDLERAIENAQLQLGEELIAAEIRFALENLSKMIGDVHSEDILSNIFSRFCIGK